MMATRLYQNPARLHFDAFRARRKGLSSDASSTAAT